MSRSPVPSTIQDPEHQNFLDELYKRRVAAISAISTTSSTASVAAALNALVAAMKASGAMEST